MWLDVRRFSETAQRELASLATQLTVIQWLAGSIPLVAALLVLPLGGGANFAFRSLVGGLILLGIIGSHVANAVTRSLSQVVTVLTASNG
jgi:hypothetical protein